LALCAPCLCLSLSVAPLSATPRDDARERGVSVVCCRWRRCLCSALSSVDGAVGALLSCWRSPTPTRPGPGPLSLSANDAGRAHTTLNCPRVPAPLLPNTPLPSCSRLPSAQSPHARDTNTPCARASSLSCVAPCTPANPTQIARARPSLLYERLRSRPRRCTPCTLTRWRRHRPPLRARAAAPGPPRRAPNRGAT